ncbi:MAG: patatin-like phospholipase family protein [Proteobacteria bacterium]|nr:patatin-like phospholipase family protein [Pseudomonadota bacterium]
MLALFGTMSVVFAETGDIPRRVSIAVSGGASMGAYEAGLNWGLLMIVRQYPQDDPVVGGRSRSIELSSVAGASAGGINSILSGLVWCTKDAQHGGIPNRIDDNLFRDVWLSIDINSLLPSEPNSPIYLPGDGVLSRSDLDKAAQELNKKWKLPAFRSGCSLPLGVSVTRVVPEYLKVNNVDVQNQRFVIPFELRVQPDDTVGYYFNPSSFYAQRDLSMLVMPSQESGTKFRLADKTVVDVALASAAFPIAFGRMRLAYCRPQADYSENEDKNSAASKETSPATSQLTCPEGYQRMEADFVDGGLFDNIPLGLARKLAEKNIHARDNPLPVDYIYIDPDSTRYSFPKPAKKDNCQRKDAPAACREMEFGLISQGRALIDAFGTARGYELFQEMVSDRWRLNLTIISMELANKLETNKKQPDCTAELSWFDQSLTCADALRHSSDLLKIAYIYSQVPLSSPLSVSKLQDQGLVRNCNGPDKTVLGRKIDLCEMDTIKYRYKLARAIQKIYLLSGLELPDIERRIRESLISIYNDRQVYISTRGGAITGTMLGGFAAFFDRKFREYDYYVGIYDAVVLISDNKCSRLFLSDQQLDEYHRCFDSVAQRSYKILGIDQDPRARYVFSLLARNEFGARGYLNFSYVSEIPVDTDLQIIHAGLIKSQEVTDPERADDLGLFAVEEEFFEYLKQNNFTPTATPGEGESMLALIMEDPEQWPYEFTRRSTDRMVYLEQQADAIEAKREPDPDERTPSLTTIVAAGAYALQTGTYKYPKFAFAPSTAPSSWWWRNLIPYEIGVDLGDGDLLLTWQPTWALSDHNKLGLRGSLGFEGGLLGHQTDSSGNDVEPNNYVSLGLDYTYLTGSTGVSGWGITPTYYHYLDPPTQSKQDTFGGDVHVGFIKNRFRLGLGVQDYDNFSDTWFIQLGVADIPGLIYWLTR